MYFLSERSLVFFSNKVSAVLLSKNLDANSKEFIHKCDHVVVLVSRRANFALRCNFERNYKYSFSLLLFVMI